LVTLKLPEASKWLVNTGVQSTGCGGRFVAVERIKSPFETPPVPRMVRFVPEIIVGLKRKPLEKPEPVR
jgi:hypothetical protein